MSAPPTIARASRSAPVKARLPFPAAALFAADPAPAPAPLPLAPALPPLPPPLPLPPLLPPLPPAPRVPPVPVGVVGVVLPPGATAWLSASPPETFRTDVSPLISTNAASASRTPYGALVWLPLVSSAAPTSARSGASEANTVFGVPSAKPWDGIGTPFPPSSRNFELLV